MDKEIRPNGSYNVINSSENNAACGRCAVGRKDRERTG